MNSPTPDPKPRDEKRENGAGQPADPLADAVKAMFNDSLDGAVLKGTPFDVSKELAAPIDWRISLTGIGEGGPIYSDHGDGAPVDQRTAPPVDFRVARRFARGKLDDKDETRVENLSNRYLAWQYAVGAAESEVQWKTGKVAPVDFDQVCKYARNELTADAAQSVRMCCQKYESWRMAVAAAEVELVCLSDQHRN